MAGFQKDQFSFSWELLKITVRRKICEGRRVRSKSLSVSGKDKRIPEEIPKGEVPSAKKKSASLEEQ